MYCIYTSPKSKSKDNRKTIERQSKDDTRKVKLLLILITLSATVKHGVLPAFEEII